MLCNVSLSTPIACSLLCFPGMTSLFAKVNKSSCVHFRALFLKFPDFWMFLNIQIHLRILKTYDGQFTLTTKKLLHIIFKRGPVKSRVGAFPEVFNMADSRLHGRKSRGMGRRVPFQYLALGDTNAIVPQILSCFKITGSILLALQCSKKLTNPVTLTEYSLLPKNTSSVSTEYEQESLL